MKEKYRPIENKTGLKMPFLGIVILLVAFLNFAEAGETEEFLSFELKNDIFRGLERSLRSPEGLLYTRLDRKTFLSETISLEMELNVRRGRRDAFDRQVRLLEKHFLSPLDLLYWELDDDLHPTATANASIDDLRACRALIGAYRRWKVPRYLELARRLGDSILRYNTVGDLLVDGCSWRKRSFGRRKAFEPKSYLTLSYADIRTMELLAIQNAKWLPVVQRSWGVLLAGMHNRTTPRWGYDGGKNIYDDRDDNTINKMMFLNHLAEVDSLPRAPVNLLLDELKGKGMLLCSNEEENIAVYALAAMLFQRTGHPEAARKAISRLARFRIGSGDGEGLLGYGDGAIWTFDNLLALIAMEEVLHRPEEELLFD